jgi:hypothetical protein
LLVAVVAEYSTVLVVVLEDIDAPFLENSQED